MALDQGEIAERIELAKAKMQRVIGHFQYLLELHANNSFVVFSEELSSQIPYSYAANAFRVFQRSMYQFEIVRLCALWDGDRDVEKLNIPTVVKLIDDDEIIEMLAEEARSRNIFGREALTSYINTDNDPVIAAEMERDRAASLKYADEQASKARTELRQAIEDARAVRGSARLASIMNIRDKHLAHSLETTRREKKDGPVQPMKYGDETKLLNASIPIVERLYCWVNGTRFSIEDAQKTDQHNAEALWTACKFVDPR